MTTAGGPAHLEGSAAVARALGFVSTIISRLGFKLELQNWRARIAATMLGRRMKSDRQADRVSRRRFLTRPALALFQVSLLALSAVSFKVIPERVLGAHLTMGNRLFVGSLFLYILLLVLYAGTPAFRKAASFTRAATRGMAMHVAAIPIIFAVIVLFGASLSTYDERVTVVSNTS